MEAKCRICGRSFSDGRQIVVLAAKHACERSHGGRRGRYTVRSPSDKAAARGRYAGTPELVQRVRMEGCLAYIDGEGRASNPYEGLNVKRAWLEGWMVAEMAHKEGMYE